MRIPTALIVFVTAICVVVAVGTAARAQDEPNPIVAQVKATVTDPAKPFTLLVSLKTKEGAGEKLGAAVGKAVKSFRAEKGCAVYELNRDAKTPTNYVVYERWHDVAALEVHIRSDAFRSLVAELDGVIDGPPDVKVMLPVAE